MADAKLTALSSAAALDGTELIYLSQVGVSKKVLLSTISTFFNVGDVGIGGNLTVVGNIASTTGNLSVTAGEGKDGVIVSGRSGGSSGFYSTIMSGVLASNINLVLPNTSGTISTLNGTETLTNKSIDASQLSGTVAAARIVARQTFSNAAASITAGNNVVAQTGTMSASRVLTLPAANALTAGDRIFIIDESGTVTATNTIVVTRAGSDTINGATTATISVAYGNCLLESDGSSKWSIAGNTGPGDFTTASIGGATTLGGTLLFRPDNTNAIGANGASRPSTIWVGSSVVSPTYWVGALTAQFNSVSNGIISLSNGAGTGFVRLGFGTTGSTSPALETTIAATPTLTVRAADGSGICNLSVTGATTLTGLLTANGGITIGSAQALKLGNAATTGLTAGVLAATTNATVTITDSTGQVYRIPCII